MISKITIVVIFAFVIAFSSLYIINDWYRASNDPVKKWYIQYNEDPSKQRVIILGNSHVQVMNHTNIERYLSLHEKNYKIFIWFKHADRPTNRLSTIDEIIDLHPAIVMYGIGMGELNEVDIDSGPIIDDQQQITSTKLLPDPHDLVKKFMDSYDIRGIDFLNFENPKITTLSIMKDVIVRIEDQDLNDNEITVTNHSIIHPIFVQKNTNESPNTYLVPSTIILLSDNFDGTISSQITYTDGSTSTMNLTQFRINQFVSSYKTTVKDARVHTPENDIRGRELMFSRIATDEEIKREITEYKQTGPLDIKESNSQVIAFEKIISKLREHNIRVIIFSTPENRLMLEGYRPSDVEDFNSIVQETAKKYGAEFYSLTDRYADLKIWSDSNHITTNPRGLIYSEDIAKMILGEFK